MNEYNILLSVRNIIKSLAVCFRIKVFYRLLFKISRYFLGIYSKLKMKKDEPADSIMSFLARIFSSLYIHIGLISNVQGLFLKRFLIKCFIAEMKSLL